mgnify:CR=1 FL=1
MVAGHAVGWPFPRGGAGALTRALRSCLESLGGVVETDAPVADLGDLPKAKAILLDLTPRQVVEISHGALPEGYRRRLAAWGYAPGAFKVNGPWTDRSPGRRRRAAGPAPSTWAGRSKR